MTNEGKIALFLVVGSLLMAAGSMISLRWAPPGEVPISYLAETYGSTDQWVDPY